jgi:tetratricopeptide (TPR) repeat protein
MTLVPVLMFGVLEGSLRVFGYGYSTKFFLDGAKVARSDVWIDNQDFTNWVFPEDLDTTSKPIPFVLPKVKKEKTCRVFVLGESAALGFPDPSTSFARILEAMLRARYPDIRFEVVNTAMVAINSHVVLPITQQCARCQPDLFVVHLGNNEVVGPFGVAGVLGPFSPSLGIVRANLAVKTTRSGQLLNRVVQKFGRSRQSPRVWDGMATFASSHVRADDTRLERIYTHFRDNLRDICRAGADASIPVIVCTIPVNLKDSAPFGSAHGADLDEGQAKAWDSAYRNGIRLEREKNYAAALRSYGSAAQIDDTFAELAFRMGRCYLSLGKNSEARQQFERARDLDTLRFRADTTIEDTIRSVVAAEESAGARLADAERVFARNSPGGIAGEEFFLEHVHMNFHGNYLLARTVFESIVALAPPVLGSSSSKAVPPSEQECAARLARTDWQELKTTTDIYRMLTSHEPFPAQLDYEERGKRWKQKLNAVKARLDSGALEKAGTAYQKAIELNEEDWMIRSNFAELLSAIGKVEEAEKQYRAILLILPQDLGTRCKLGGLLLAQGRVKEAGECYRDVIHLSPDYMTGQLGLAETLMAQGKYDEAGAIFEKQARKGPNRVLALLALGRYFIRTGKLERASECCHEALQIASNNPLVCLQLADIAQRQEKMDEAIEHYEAALRIYPDWPGVHEQIARLRKKPRKTN